MRSLVTGILAHVDAGKTTCIESMLVDGGVLRKAGRVDHQNAFLDYDELEKKRGITIYAKQAGLEWNDVAIHLIDTPGHADFSAEMERTLSVLDCAIVLISALDGVQAHTRTIWKCLKTYQIPAIFFINKMDAAILSQEELLKDLKKLDDRIVDLQANDYIEQFAALDEELLEKFLEEETLSTHDMAKTVMERKAFPVLFGSALKNEGVKQLLDALTTYTLPIEYPEEFGARIFKMTQDETSVPIVHMKITGGTLKTRDVINEEKIDQIRLYQGQGFQPVLQAQAGDVVSVKGLTKVKAGDGLGFEQNQAKALLSPCLYYELILPDGIDPVQMMGSMRLLMMEDPSLQVEFHEDTQSIALHLMGQIQKDVLKKKIQEKSGIQVEFGPGKVVYKETIEETVFGYGHFEPLRHYAEVHLELEPGKRGSGLSFSSKVPRDILSLNWQRLILSALSEAHLTGVLSGSALEDMKITLINGRAHQKHTSGGDFRQAALRAVRQGLKKAKNILLEPYLAFEIQTTAEHVSKILYQLDIREAIVEVKEAENGMTLIEGRGPIRTLMNFQEELAKASRGSANFIFENDGYDVCQNSQPILEEIGYDERLDRRNPSASVFCSNGAGVMVEWDEVEDHLHIPIQSNEEMVSSISMNSGKVSEEELKKVFQSAGGANRNSKKDNSTKKKRTELSLEPTHVKTFSHLPTCLIVDGYNMIYSWDDLKALASQSLFAAREQLISELVNYQGYKGYSLIIVFDGTRQKDNLGSSSRNGSSSIVYTPAGMTADSFIEKKVYELRNKFQCIAATSDGLIQNSVFSHGARRISARELQGAVRAANHNAFSDLHHWNQSNSKGKKETKSQKANPSKAK